MPAGLSLFRFVMLHSLKQDAPTATAEALESLGLKAAPSSGLRCYREVTASRLSDLRQSSLHKGLRTGWVYISLTSRITPAAQPGENSNVHSFPGDDGYATPL